MDSGLLDEDEDDDVVVEGRIEAGEKAMTPEPAAMKADKATAAAEEEDTMVVIVFMTYAGYVCVTNNVVVSSGDE